MILRKLLCAIVYPDMSKDNDDNVAHTGFLTQNCSRILQPYIYLAL